MSGSNPERTLQIDECRQPWQSWIKEVAPLVPAISPVQEDPGSHGDDHQGSKHRPGWCWTNPLDKIIELSDLAGQNLPMGKLTLFVHLQPWRARLLLDYPSS